MRRKAVFCMMLIAWACRSVALADGSRIFDEAANWDSPEAVTVSDQDLFPDPAYSHDWKSRSISLNGRLDDGTFFVINLFSWQVGFLQAWGLVVLATDKEGRIYEYEGRLPEDQGDPSRAFDHRFGANRFRCSHREHTFKISLEGFSCDLQVANLLPAWKPGDGWAYYDGTGSAFRHYAAPAPLATVSGSMSVFGVAREVAGVCSLDSRLSVQPLERPNTPQHLLWAYEAADVPQGESLFIDLYESFTDRRYGGIAIPVLVVAKGSSWLFTTKDFTLVPSDWTTVADVPRPYPGRYHLRAGGRGWSLEGEFRCGLLYCVTDIFQKLPPPIRSLAAALMPRPITFRMVGEFQGWLTSPDGNRQPIVMPAHGEYMEVN